MNHCREKLLFFVDAGLFRLDKMESAFYIIENFTGTTEQKSVKTF